MSDKESNVFNFRTKERVSYSAEKPYTETPAELPVNTGAEITTTLPTVRPAYVKVRADMFHKMLDTLAFYANQGFDHGQMAKSLLNEEMK